MYASYPFGETPQEEKKRKDDERYQTEYRAIMQAYEKEKIKRYQSDMPSDMSSYMSSYMSNMKTHDEVKTQKRKLEYESHSETESESDDEVTVNQQSPQTEIVIHPKMANITCGSEDIVYCPTIQLCWNLWMSFVNVTKMNTLDRSRQQAIDALCECHFNTKDIDEKSCYATFGTCPSIVAEIKETLRTRFNEETQMDMDGGKYGDILFYAFLRKILTFKTPFHTYKDFESLTWNQNSLKTRVRGFGIKKKSYGNDTVDEENMRKQVSVYSAENAHLITISLPDDDVILYCPLYPSSTTLYDMTQTCLMKLNNPEPLTKQDTLKIPNIKMRLKKSFPELRNLQIMESNYTIVDNQQIIDFSLDETGAKVRSEACMMARCCGGGGSEGKTILFDHPFLLLMREKQSSVPYFAMWVATPQYMNE